MRNNMDMHRSKKVVLVVVIDVVHYCVLGFDLRNSVDAITGRRVLFNAFLAKCMEQDPTPRIWLFSTLVGKTRCQYAVLEF